jgi:hypothetical protein
MSAAFFADDRERIRNAASWTMDEATRVFVQDGGVVYRTELFPLDEGEVFVHVILCRID